MYIEMIRLLRCGGCDTAHIDAALFSSNTKERKNVSLIDDGLEEWIPHIVKARKSSIEYSVLLLLDLLNIIA